MALIINTNISSLIAQQNLSVTSSQLKVSVQRLSSGFRVNSSADDAAGLARADQLRGQTRMIQASMRNINDGVSAMEISDKAAEQITNIVTRMSELAASSAQGTLDSGTRSYYSDEYDKLLSEIDRIANTTEFGGFKLLNGSTSALTMYIGFKNTSNDQLSVSLMSLTTVSGLQLSSGILATQTGALSAIDTISTALKAINDARAVYGASTNRLSAALSNLQVTFTNYQAAESRIRDADFAFETAQYTKNQIMVQAGTSVLAQANTLPQSALTLLR
ncbi:MAG TPA: flagellin [Thermodesulfobacteriota bacterium]|nr:flagellin [Thermodesulfobacteriota bacterium]